MEAIGGIFMIVWLGVIVYVLSLLSRLVNAVERISATMRQKWLDELVED